MERPAPPREETLLYEGQHLLLKKTGSWEYVERRFRAGGVMVVAVTGDGKLLLVEEDRPPVGGRVISLPAGLVGDDGHSEDPAVAAARELREETGFEPDAPLEFLGEGPSSPGLASENVAFYAARRVRRAPASRPEGGITVHTIGLADVRAWTRRRESEGVRIHPLLWAGLYLAGI